MLARTGQAIYLKNKSIKLPSFGWLKGVIAVVLVVAFIVTMNKYMSDPFILPVNKIRMHGSFINVDESMLSHAINDVVAGGYFNVDVDHVREEIEQLAWVDKASVRRVWPDTLSVNITERLPVAQLKNSGLISNDGELFNPKKNTYPGNLPVFEGPEKLKEVMLARFYQLNKLLTVIGKKIIYLKLDARYALTLHLDSGLKIILGREASIFRLKRFLKIYSATLAQRIVDIESIDLRYTNGMAISWKKISKVAKVREET